MSVAYFKSKFDTAIFFAYFWGIIKIDLIFLVMNIESVLFPFLLFGIIQFVIFIILLIKWWKMANAVIAIKSQLERVSTDSKDNPRLTYLLAIGDKERAEREAAIMIVDKLMPIYYSKLSDSKEIEMDNYLRTVLPKLNNMGIILPDRFCSGRKFITFLDDITGK